MLLFDYARSQGVGVKHTLHCEVLECESDNSDIVGDFLTLFTGCTNRYAKGIHKAEKGK
jgi:hypothetical protein